MGVRGFDWRQMCVPSRRVSGHPRGGYGTETGTDTDWPRERRQPAAKEESTIHDATSPHPKRAQETRAISGESDSERRAPFGRDTPEVTCPENSPGVAAGTAKNVQPGSPTVHEL